MPGWPWLLGPLVLLACTRLDLEGNTWICERDEHCGAGWRCQNGLCVAAGTLPDAAHSDLPADTGPDVPGRPDGGPDQTVLPDGPTDVTPDEPPPPDGGPDHSPDLPGVPDGAGELHPELPAPPDGGGDQAADLPQLPDGLGDTVSDGPGPPDSAPDGASDTPADAPHELDLVADEAAGPADAPDGLDADVRSPECVGDADCPPCFPCIRETGTCALAPAPDGTACDDGDPATAYTSCQAGACLCNPDCTGRSCGDDGCGAACGPACPAGFECDILGQCAWTGWTCGETACPYLATDDDVLPDYAVDCNAQDHCEYRYVGPDLAPWRQWDVWIWVPPGAFEMGAPASEAGTKGDERPVHTVTVARGYFVSKYEVPVGAYESCEADGSCTPPSTADWDGEGWGVNRSNRGRSDHPQNGLTWLQATQFCAWNGGRLPSEAEWEYLAAGPVHRAYPWGDLPAPDCARAVFDGDGNGQRPWGCEACTSPGCSGTSPVGSRLDGACYVGAVDVAGNVLEWCSDWYHPDYTGSPVDGSPWVSPGGTQRVQRNGSFYGSWTCQRLAWRDGDPPSNRSAMNGARCVRDHSPIGLYCPKAACPALPGYATACNAQGHCEYTRSEQSAPWHAWDVWIWVPPGAFDMGAPSGEPEYDRERPVHTVQFARGYFVAKYEATVAQYEACEADSGACSAPSTADWDGLGWSTNRSANDRPDHPQNGLTWEQAGVFCAWQGGRLPSEAEWEYAATGPVHRKYPWGDAPEPDCDHAVFDDAGAQNTRPWGCESCTDSGCSGTQAAGSRPAGASYLGALDMSGNVWEWVADWLHPSYEGAPSDGSAWVDPQPAWGGAIRGGAFWGDGVALRVAYRGGDPPEARRAGSGVRCARDLPPTCEPSDVTVLRDMPTPAAPHASRPRDGAIYLVGGTIDGDACSPNVWRYNIADDTYDDLGPLLPYARCAPGGSITLAWGDNGRLYSGPTLGPTTSPVGSHACVIEIDPNGPSATERACFPSNRWNLAAVNGADGFIYFLGGWRGSSIQSIYRYDPLTDVLEDTQATITVAGNAFQSSGNAIHTDGSIYFFLNGEYGGGQIARFDPLTLAFDSFGQHSVGEARVDPVWLGSDGALYGLGSNSRTDTRSIVSYDPATAAFSSLDLGSDVFVPGLVMRAFAVDPTVPALYSFGGRVDGGAFSTSALRWNCLPGM